MTTNPTANGTLLLAVSDDGIARAEWSESGRWAVTRPEVNSEVECLVADPANSARLYVGTRDGVRTSRDGGRTWENRGLNGVIVKSLAVSPHDSQVVFAGAKPARLYVTRDGGATWTELGGFQRIPNRWWWFSPADPRDWRAYVMSIAVSPTDPNVILAGVELGAVVRSEDGGRTWSRHRRGALRDCHSLKFHPTDGKWAYEAGGTGGGASFSQDGGLTFRKMKQGLAKNYGIVCAADPEKPEIWYVCVAPGPFNAFGDNPEIYLYRATGAAGWEPIGWQAHPLPATPTALTAVPGAPGHLYAGLHNGDVWHTADYGDTWEKLPFNLGGIRFSLLVLERTASGGTKMDNRTHVSTAL